VGPATTQSPADLLQSRYLRFGRLTAKNGLSNLQVRGVTQDNYGFMWFGTHHGLNRYDGAGVKVYRHDRGDLGWHARRRVRQIRSGSRALYTLQTRCRQAPQPEL
jgi:ligand-binding sensor domain-containing protein